MTPNQNLQIDSALAIVEEGPHSPYFPDAWEFLALCEDPAIRFAMHQAMEQTFGPFPPATGYSDSGEPYWELDVMSTYLNIPQEELLETAIDIQEKWGDQAGIADTRQLHRLH